MGQEAEVLADDPLDRPAEQRLGRVGHEREDALRVGAPDDVRRRLDEAAEARLLLGDAREQVRVRQGDGGLVGEALEQVQIVGLERRAASTVEIGERPDDLAARARAAAPRPSRRRPIRLATA